MKHMLKYLMIGLTSFLLSCSIQYGMIDGSIDAETFSVAIFEEQAANAPAGYGVSYTEFLKDFMVSRTKLNLKNGDADIEVYGRISFFNTSPLGVQSGDAVATNQLKVTMDVTVINNVNEEQSFEQNFSQISEFTADQDLASVQDALLDDINEKISQDIINRLTSNW